MFSVAQTAANPEDETRQCAQQFEIFRSCLEQEEEYYGQPVDTIDGVSGLQEAWETLIREDLKEVERRPFPDHLLPRFETKDGVRMLLKPEKLVLVFAQQDEILVTAGSKEDLRLEADNRLSFRIPPGATIASAVYELDSSCPGAESSNVIVYIHRFR